MFKYLSARHSPHPTGQTWVAKSIWILLSVCVWIAMTNSAQAAKGVDNMDMWSDGFTSNRYPTAENACLGNATWINSHPSYGYILSLASINAPALPTGNWSCQYSGVLLDKNHTPMPFPAANISIFRYYYCPRMRMLLLLLQTNCRAGYVNATPISMPISPTSIANPIFLPSLSAMHQQEML